MSKSAHEGVYLDDCVHSVSKAAGRADIICLSPSHEDYELSAAMWDANARLIAAAPEMLEALIQATAHLSAGIQTNQGSHEEPPEPASQWDYEAGLLAGDLLRLIAKATGEGA